MTTDANNEDQSLETIQQVEVPFLSEMILALLGSDGEIYVPVVPFGERLGLGSPNRQIDRIRRDDALKTGLRTMPLDTDGGVQKAKCLRLNTFALWLATISENMCKPEIRPTLKYYKLEAADAIIEHFKMKAAALKAKSLVPKLQSAITERPPMPAARSSPEEWRAWHLAMADVYQALAQQGAMIAQHQHQLDRHEKTISEHDREIIALSDDMTSVKETLAIMGEMPEPRISIAQANQIQALVSKIHEATKIHQATIFAAFKKQWHLPRYDELPAVQFDDAYEWLRQWGRARLPKKP